MSTTPAVSGIHEEELHFMRYFLAIKTGGTTMARVFEWGYQGGHPIKNYLLSQPGYSNRKFKNDFNSAQRRKLTSNTAADVRSYDISLLFTLLQLACGLADSNDPVWSTPGPSLEYLLYRLKQIRNHVAHEEQHLTQQALDTKLSDLQQLLENIYISAATRFGKSSLLVTHLSTELCQQFVSIKTKIREDLQPSDLAELTQLEQEIQFFGKQLMLKVKQMGVKELAEQYQFLYMIDPVPWLHLSVDVKFKPSVAFTKLQIQEDEVVTARPSQMKRGREVKCEEILRVRRKDGTAPDVIIMTGEGGIGKTTLLKYLTEKWVCDQGAVYDLDQVDILLYIQCRESGIRSFDELLQQLLCKTLQGSRVNLDFFRDTVLRLKTIVLIDGYNEANENSKILVKNILQVAGKIRVIVTSRPSGDHLSPLIPSGKRRLDLLVKGIIPELRSQFIGSMLDILVKQADKKADIKENVHAKLDYLSFTLGDHLNNPLTLTLVTVLWVEWPDRFNAFTTVTDLYDEIRDLMTNKLEKWLTGNVADAAEKIEQFLIVHDDIALQTLKNLEFDLSQATVTTLTQKCTSLGLPHEDVLSTYFTKKRSRQGLKLIWIWSYLHAGFQEHAASRSMKRTLLDLSHKQGHTGHQSTAEDKNTNVIEKMFVDTSWRHQNIEMSMLLRLTGILTRSDEHLSRYAPQILKLVPVQISYDGSTVLANYLSLVIESKYHQGTLQEVAQTLSQHRIWSTLGHYMKALPSVLSQTEPEEIRMDIIMDPELCLGLREALASLAKTKVNVRLLLSKHYSTSEGTSDAFIRALTSDSCTMSNFTGRLASPNLLPVSLRRLWLRCTREELLELTLRLPSLRLEDLCIKMELLAEERPDSFPVIMLTGVRLTMRVDVTITDDPAQLDWCCDVFRQMRPHDEQQSYDSIVIYETLLTRVGVERLLRGLYQRGLLVGSLSIFSCNAISDDEKEALTALYKDLGGKRLQLEKTYIDKMR